MWHPGTVVVVFQAQLMMSVSFLWPHVPPTNSEVISKHDLLDDINGLTTGSWGSLCVSKPHDHRSMPVPDLLERHFEGARQKADMIAGVLKDLGMLDNQGLLNATMINLVRSEDLIEMVRIVTFSPGRPPVGDLQFYHFAHVKRPQSVTYKDPVVELNYGINGTVMSGEPKNQTAEHNYVRLADLPWYEHPFQCGQKCRKFLPKNRLPVQCLGWWTYPYYWCPTHKWQMTYTIHIVPNIPNPMLEAILSFDVDVSKIDINQCDASDDVKQSQQINFFAGTHKCHQETTTCNFTAGHGWTNGGYTCECRKGYYNKLNATSINGTKAELAWRDRLRVDSAYDVYYKCVPCSAGCDTCSDDSPCLAPFNHDLGVMLLSISMMWIVVAIGLMGAVYRYRKLKVFKVASPIFLCITLLGCAIMYGEMAAIFPPLETANCIATKWTRHMGFCVTYSALLMKTWRVSLTYRIKSAHKLKLTDRQLLQWMFPILLVMVVYLAAWTASSPPTGEIMFVDDTNLKFTQCTYNWWDHSLAIGEMLFLLWGIKVCYSVRHAETYFNESQHISWAIYIIAAVNIIFASFHLLFFSNTGPNLKYVFGFIRTQLSTTLTIGVVFGPKFYLVVRGRGDEHDNRARARGVTASFSLNGIGMANTEEPPDLQRENEELKEELQKLSSQMEFMKIVHMSINNPHLKLKSTSHFSPSNVSFMATSTLTRREQTTANSQIIAQVQTHSPGEEIVPSDSPTTELLGENA